MSYFVLPKYAEYLHVGLSELFTLVDKVRAVFLLSITRYFVVSVRRCFLFLLVLRIGF